MKIWSFCVIYDRSAAVTKCGHDFRGQRWALPVSLKLWNCLGFLPTTPFSSGFSAFNHVSSWFINLEIRPIFHEIIWAYSYLILPKFSKNIYCVEIVRTALISPSLFLFYLKPQLDVSSCAVQYPPVLQIPSNARPSFFRGFLLFLLKKKDFLCCNGAMQSLFLVSHGPFPSASGIRGRYIIRRGAMFFP